MSDDDAPPTPVRYHAFLSYSHQDNLPRRADDPPDAPSRIAWADWHHHALETYRVPRSFIGRSNRHGEPIPVRLVPCFQDEKELPTESRLQGTIEEALRASRHLIVLFSPRSARSIYVNAEVLYFKKLGRADRILPIIIGGEPNAALAGHKRGFTPDDECFCPALKHALRADGTLDETTGEEPICADARWGEQREVTAAEQRLARPALEHAKLKLIAGLLGVGFDDLAQRERQRQFRARRHRAALIGTIMAVILAFAGVAWWQRGQAIEQSEKRRALLAEAARSDRLVAEENLLTGKEREAFAHLARACGYDPRSTRVVAEKAAAALNVWKQTLPVAILTGHALSVMSVQFSPDGTRIVTASVDHTARLWGAATDKSLATLAGHEDRLWSAQFSPDGTRIVTASSDKTARVWDAATAQGIVTLVGHESGVSIAQFSPDGTRIVTASSDKTARVWDVATGQSLITLVEHEGGISSAQFSPEGTRIVTVSSDKTARVWDAATGKSLAILSGHESSLTSAQFSPDGARIVTASADKTARVWDTATGVIKSGTRS